MKDRRKSLWNALVHILFNSTTCRNLHKHESKGKNRVGSPKSHLE